jgi:D-alanyl-D-alanine carboxypeptidase (penicillin-binding protein 5/6)
VKIMVRSFIRIGFIKIYLIIFLFTTLFPLGVFAKSEEINENKYSAEAFIIIDAKTGNVVDGRNEHTTNYPASITKIMTALLALESKKISEEVVVSKKARSADGNRIYLAEGEKKPLIDLLYGIMLNSGNDAAIAIAEHLGVTIEGFADMMNNKAKKLGALNTHFVNPNGLHEEEHYTTAYDMALIARAAMKKPLFREIVTTKTMPWFGDEWHSSLVNSNKLLWRYEGSTGIKTGYTSKAQQTIVASAERDGTELIVVLMKVQGRNNLWTEATSLLDYGFEQVYTKKIKSKGDMVSALIENQVHSLQVEEDIYVTLPNEGGDSFTWSEELIIELPESQYFILNAGSKIGRIMIKENDKLIGQANLSLTKEISVKAQSTFVMNDKHSSIGKQVTGLDIWYVPFILIFSVWVHHRIISRRYHGQCKYGYSNQGYSNQKNIHM